MPKDWRKLENEDYSRSLNLSKLEGLNQSSEIMTEKAKNGIYNFIDYSANNAIFDLIEEIQRP